MVVQGGSRRPGADEMIGGLAVASGEEVETQFSPNKLVLSNTALNVFNTVKNMFRIVNNKVPITVKPSILPEAWIGVS